MLNLSCVISQSADQFQYIFWHKDNKVINFELSQTDRGRVVISKVAQKLHTTVSNLIINSVRPSDSGNYTCRLSGATPASIQVHALEQTSAVDSLMMFQNDDQQHLSPANSGRLSAHSSASSRHSNVIRVTPNRLLALSLAFLICHSWLQLVLQLQTAISLFLLAIIGCFIGKLTERPLHFKDATEEQQKELKFYTKHNDSTLFNKSICRKAEQADKTSQKHHTFLYDSNIYGKQKFIDELERQKQLNSTYQSMSRMGLISESSIQSSDINSTSTPLLVDPALLERANSALNLLRNLADAAKSQSTLKKTTTTTAIIEPKQQLTLESPTSVKTSPLDCWSERIGSGASSTTSGAASTSAGRQSGAGDHSSGHHSLDISDERHSSEAADSTDRQPEQHSELDIHRVVSHSRLKSVRLIPFRGTGSGTNLIKSNLFNIADDNNNNNHDKSCIDAQSTRLNNENLNEAQRLLLQVAHHKQQFNRMDSQLSDYESKLESLHESGDKIELPAKQPISLSLLMNRLTLADTNHDHSNQQHLDEPHYLTPTRSNNNLSATNNNNQFNFTQLNASSSLRRS